MNFGDGAVYTKTWVVDLMLDAIGYTPDKDLSSFRILEPSCGSGAFVVPIVRRLCASVAGRKDVGALSGCIKAIDIDESSAGLCVSNIVAELVDNGYSKEDAECLAGKWVSVEDFLLGTHADYDYVVGNPPYIRSEDLAPDVRRRYAERLSTVTMGTDLYVGFIESGLRSLSARGKLCYICADRWMQNRYGGRLRRFVSNGYGVELICRMHGVDAFESEVSAYPAITVIGTDRRRACRYVACSDDLDDSDSGDLLRSMLGESVGNGRITATETTVGGSGPWPLSDSDKIRTVEELTSRFPTIEDSGVRIGIGVATGRDDVFITTDGGLVEKDRMLPLIRREDLVGGETPDEAVHWLVNPWDGDGELIDLSDYPLTRSYLEKHGDALRGRHIAKKNAERWYRTIDKVNPGLLSKPKLLMRDMSKHPDPFFDGGNFYPGHNMYWMTSERWDLKALGGLLMSEQVESFIDAIGVKMRGNTMRCQAQYLRMLHIPHPEDLDDADMKGFRAAFESRDRDLATACMDRVLKRGSVTDEGQHEAGTAEVI